MQRTLQLFIFVVLWCASSAHAADTPKLVIIPFTVGEGASDSATSRFNAQLAEALKSRDDEVTVVANPQTRAPDKTAAGKKAPAPEAVAAIAAGKKALEELKFDEAVERLKKGIELQLAEPASADHPAITEAQLQLAVAAFRMGEEKEAQSALQAIARTTVDFEVPGGYPPIFAREFEKAKKRLDKQAKGTISIEGPAGSTAFVDGRDLGMVPVLEENLAMGAHAVRVEGTKGERFGQTVELKGGISKVKANFGAAAAPSSDRQPARVQDPAVAATLDEAAAGRVATYARAAQADYALVGVVYRSGDSQLTAGSALYALKRQAFTVLPPILFDAEALTSNVEAFKLVDAVVKRLDAFGTVASVPFPLAQRARGAAVATVTPVKDVEGVSAARPVLVPKDPGVTSPIDVPHDEPPPAEIKSGVPVWVWVVVGVGVAAGAGVGGYFGYRAATRPVTGTVNASW